MRRLTIRASSCCSSTPESRLITTSAASKNQRKPQGSLRSYTSTFLLRLSSDDCANSAASEAHGHSPSYDTIDRQRSRSSTKPLSESRPLIHQSGMSGPMLPLSRALLATFLSNHLAAVPRHLVPRLRIRSDKDGWTGKCRPSRALLSLQGGCAALQRTILDHHRPKLPWAYRRKSVQQQ